LIEATGSKPLIKKTYWMLKRKKTDIIEILKKTNNEDIYREYTKKRIRMLENKEFLNMDKLFPYCLDFLKQLKKKNRLVLVTLRRSKKNALDQLKKLKIYGFFDNVIINFNSIQKKEKIKAYLIRKDKGFNCNSIIIGDTEVDIKVAEILNIKSIALLSGIREKKKLLVYKPDFIFNSLKEVYKFLLDISCG
jgi:phosphoglycolate phosphatase-like HAD superfamily hydrolase